MRSPAIFLRGSLCLRESEEDEESSERRKLSWPDDEVAKILSQLLECFVDWRLNAWEIAC
ncbi:hypothetical protein COLO4_36600 [Corchorus olitorius]|uniref:Uncharacterized protein n=1 Tax=Corchorus olitorius TaxID=93759 RepID=A0A1R3G7J5_9ROSI|nr:hypothetical protein COLO4_36600 [Corchorus olitorius]